MTQAGNNSAASILRKILAATSMQWLAILPDLYWLVRQWLEKQQYGGMYEILDYDVTLELADPTGETAHFKKHLQIKFLQDEIIAFPDYTWGDGDIFANYRCAPGIVGDRYKEGDRWTSVIIFNETKNRGDITPLDIEWTAKNGFTATDEALQTEIRHQTKHLKVTILFPPERRCDRVVMIERSRHRSTVLGPEYFTILPGGRQRVTWETTHIKRFEVYTLKWHW